MAEERQELQALLGQYSLFQQRWLHFGRLFWGIPAIAIGGITILVRTQPGDQINWALFASAGIMLLASVIAHRFRRLEDRYELLMREIEESIAARTDGAIVQGPLSARWGTRSLFAFLLLLASMAMLGCALWT